MDTKPNSIPVIPRAASYKFYILENMLPDKKLTYEIAMDVFIKGKPIAEFEFIGKTYSSFDEAVNGIIELKKSFVPANLYDMGSYTP